MRDDVPERVGLVQDPLRVTMLQWRKARRPQYNGITSHSWLLAHLHDKTRLRLEIFADTGLLETTLVGDEPDRDSTLYDDRVASAGDFAEVLMAEHLRSVAAAAASRTAYCLVNYNCHHFALEVWNSVIAEPLRTKHYPDRVKTGMLWGVARLSAAEQVEQSEQRESSFFGSLVSQAASFASTPSNRPPQNVPSHGSGVFASIGSLGSFASGQPVVPRGPARAQISSRRAVHGRVTGTCSGCSRTATDFDSAGRVERFMETLETGAALLLEPGHAPVVMELPGRAGSEAWGRAWLPDLSSGTALRLAERLNKADATDVARALATGFGIPEGDEAETPATEIVDAHFLVLRGLEVRLAVYAVLHSPQRQQLRLLSGDVCSGGEGSYSFSLASSPASYSAADLAHQELDALQSAIASGDWSLWQLF